jgi:hypothetical protein
MPAGYAKYAGALDRAPSRQDTDQTERKHQPMTIPCSHIRIRVIAHDDNGEFVECLDCKEIFESSELEESEPKEDLSDA